MSHNNIKLTPNVIKITLSKEDSKIAVVENNRPSITLSRVGTPGPPGPPGQDGAPVSWINVLADAEDKDIEVSITDGIVSQYDYKGSVIYRFENLTENANGYPIEDSFYSNFDGTNLTNLIVTRGI